MAKIWLAGDLLAEVVGAHTDVAGVDGPEESVRHGVHRVGQVGSAEDGVVHQGGGGGNHGGSGNNCRDSGRCGNNGRSNGRCGNDTVVSKTAEDDLSISISLPLLVVVAVVVVVVEGGGTRNWHVGAVHTRSALEAERMAVVGEAVVAAVGVGAPLLAAGHRGSQVVGAESHVAGVDEAGRGGGNGVDRVGKGRGADDSRSSSSVAKTVANGAKSSNDHLGISLSLPLLAARHSGSKVVGAETHVAGVDEAKRGGGDSVDWVGDGGGANNSGGGNGGSSNNSRGNGVDGGGGNNSVVAETSKDQLGIGLGFPLLTTKRSSSIRETSVGERGTGARHGQVQAVDARGALASEGVHSVGVGQGERGVDHVG